MNDVMREQIIADYQEMLRTDVGRRVLGGILHLTGINDVTGYMPDTAAYLAGRRDVGLAVANTLREVDAYAVAKCEAAHAELMKKYERSGDDDGDGEYGDNGGGAE